MHTYFRKSPSQHSLSRRDYRPDEEVENLAQLSIGTGTQMEDVIGTHVWQF